MKLFQQLEKSQLGPDNIAICYRYIGDSLEGLKRLEESVSYYQKSLEINLSLYGEKNYSTQTSYYRLGKIYTQKGEVDKGLKYLQCALAIGEELFGEYHEKNCFVHAAIGKTTSEEGFPILKKHDITLKLRLKTRLPPIKNRQIF